MKTIKHLKRIAIHRNGVCGAPFYVVTFVSDEDQNMIATVFDKSGYVAVLNTDKLVEGEIRFTYNSYRGDYFEKDLRSIVAKYEEAAKDMKTWEDLRKIDADFHSLLLLN